MGAAFGLGFIFGPYIGGKLSDPTVVSWFDATTPFWFAAILSFLNVISVLLFFPETNKHILREIKIKWDQSVRNIIHAYSLKQLRIIFLTVFLFQGGFAFFTTFFSLFLINRFSFAQGNIGDFFAYVGLWIAFTQAIVTRKISGKFKEKDILNFTLLGAGFVILLYFLPNVWWQLLFIVPFFALCIGLSQANITALVSKSVDASIQGEILGINASVQALAQSIPPVLSGYIAASIAPEAPIYIAAMTILIAGYIFLLFYKPHVIHQADVEN